MKCDICQKEFDKIGGLHLHLSKSHNLSQQDYYHYYYPRYDLYSGDLITYKNYTQYFETSFNTRDDFLSWIYDNYNSTNVKDYFIKEISKRADKKRYKFLPGQVVLKSLMLPSVNWLLKIYKDFGSLKNELDKVGISLRHSYKDVKIDSFDYSNLTIYTDTREQNPIHLDCETKKMCLNIGDYTASGDNFSNLFIERKSLADLCGTLSSGIERFEREISKAEALDAYIVVMVDDKYSNAIDYSSKKFNQKITGAHLFFEIRRLSEKYSNLQFIFSGSRNKSSELIKKILLMKDLAKEVDLEYLKDIGEL